MTQDFFGTRIVHHLILGRRRSLVYDGDPWGLPWCCVGLLEFQGRSHVFCTFSGGLPRRFRVVQQSFLHRDDLAFAEVLSEQDIQVAFDAEGVRFAQEEGDVYTPSVTLWAFLSQAVFKAEHRSCVAAVARVAVLMAPLNGRVLHDTGAYCRARPSYRRSYWSVWPCSWQTVEETVPSDWLWHGRHVHLVDGTTLSAPDSPANQAAWPQPTNQEDGLGFPLIRMVVLMSLATAMMTGMALDRAARQDKSLVAGRRPH